MRTPLLLLASWFLLPSLALAEGRVITSPAKGTPEEVVARLLEAGTSDDFDGFYDKLCHPDYCHQIPTDRKDKKVYMWTRFTKFVASYYTNAGARSFEVTSTQPPTLEAGTDEIKLFLKSSKRDMPVPVVLRKDKGEWKVANCSL
jgi:hypothetical protein